MAMSSSEADCASGHYVLVPPATLASPVLRMRGGAVTEAQRNVSVARAMN